MNINVPPSSKDCFSLWPVRISGFFSALCIMVSLLITSIEAVAYWTPGYYEAEYTKYHVLDDLPEMTMDDLLTVTDEMMAFLRGKRADLHVYTTIGGETREFFNEREIAHMEVVQRLFIGGLWLRRFGLLVTASYALLIVSLRKRYPAQRALLMKHVFASLCAGMAVFFAAALLITAVISTNFSKYFIVFHHIFFDNDLWILNPATDLLINIVPEPFFMDTAVRIAATFGGMSAAFLGTILFLWKKANRL